MASPEDLLKYDSALLGILQHEGELEPFLDVVFGFLFRKTDFFHVRTESQKKYGFPEGVAENLIKKHFIKYKSLTEKMINEAKEIKKRKEQSSASASNPPPQANDAEKDSQQDPKASVKSPSQDDKPKTTVATPQKQEELPKSQDDFQKNPESYNGAVRDKYSWSQNYYDIDIIVPVEKSVTRKDQVKVVIERKRLFVSITGNDGCTDTVIDDELKHEVARSDSMWSLESGKSLNIALTKGTSHWWDSLLKNEEEIDLKKITPERPMTDMAEDELAVINKLQFDEKQKRLGLPQSHEIKVHEMLKKGWNAEGSPFKGQEFDPSKFNISPSGVQ